MKRLFLELSILTALFAAAGFVIVTVFSPETPVEATR